ncbi:hypothetical protein J4731_17110 [Providencia rettgeri]|nr:hypothetical protein [Providencia rettgeri]
MDNHSERLEELASKANEIEQKASDIQQAWEQQQALVSQIITLRSTLIRR